MIIRCEEKGNIMTQMFINQKTESDRQMHQAILMVCLCAVTAIKYIIGNNI